MVNTLKYSRSYNLENEKHDYAAKMQREKGIPYEKTMEKLKHIGKYPVVKAYKK